MAQGLVGSIFAAYGGLRAAQARQAEQAGEERILFYAFLSGFLLFLAGLPTARMQAGLIEAENPLAVVLSARFFGAMFVVPLMFYGLAALSHLACRAFGGTGTFRLARLALFWAVLVTMPVLLAVSLAAVAFSALTGVAGTILGLIVLFAFARIWGEGLAETEGFGRGWPISLAVAMAPIATLATIAGVRG